MGFSLSLSVFIIVGIYSVHFSKANESLCSKFPYEEQLLEKMIRTEIKVEMMVNEIKTTQDNVLSTLADIVKLREDISEEFLKKGDEIKEKEESFQKMFEETKTNLTSVIDDQRNSLIQHQGKLERPPIAFSAHYVTDLKLDTKDEVIIFDKTFINEGTGYDTTTGIFRAPVGGLYQFVVHLCAYYDKNTYIGLVLEGTVLAAGVNYDRSQYTCNTLGAIARVKLGEQIWVKATMYGSSNYQLFQDQYRMNTFSGILVNN